MEYLDQLKNKVVLNSVPKRIISLVPSQSEYLWEIGLQKELVGITKFCIHPNEMFENVARVGGTKQLDIEKIKALKPDLIIGNKEENTKEQIEELKKHFAVWMSDVNNLEDAFEMMLHLGIICNRKTEAVELIGKIKESLKNVSGLFKNKSFAYLIWNKPYMVAASNTFIHEVLKYSGFTNVFENKSRYPETNLEELEKLKPDFCFLSTEPFPFTNIHVQELQLKLTNAKVLLVDGEMFSWYGSRLVYLQNYLLKLKKDLNV